MQSTTLTVCHIAGELYYADNPGFSHAKQVTYSIDIKVTDPCGSDTDTLVLEIAAVIAPAINVHTGSVTIYEEQVTLLYSCASIKLHCW